MLTLDRARELSGKTMVDVTGSKVGKVDSVYVDTDSERLTFATVDTGLFGTKTSFVPLDRADLRGDDVVVPFEKDVVKDAPDVPADRELTAAEEARLYAHYDAVMDVERTAAPRGADDAMTLSEERLRVGTEKTETGRVRLRKYVTTETETVQVPVAKERVAVEREPIRDGEHVASADAAFSDDAQEVVLREERPVVAKDAVPVERVRLGKDVTTDHVTVTDDVRREQVEIDEAR